MDLLLPTKIIVNTMKNSKQFQGIYPAMLTPFNSDSILDLRAMEKLVGHLYENGVDGLFVGGNMGEWFSQTIEERKSVAEHAVELSKGRGKVILHVGSSRFEDAIELAQYAAEIGADAIGSLPPYYARLSEKDIVQYYTKLSQSTSLPVFLYYHPALTGYQIGAATFEMLENVSNIAGLKFTDYDLLTLFNLINFSNKRLNIMNGHDQVLSSSLAIGATGGIGSFYNVVPSAFVSVYQLLKEGNVDEANKLQQEINRFIQVVKKFPLIPAFKFILQLNDIISENYRVSIAPLSQSDKNQLERDLDENIFYNKWKIGSQTLKAVS
jgi:N-acetylneuraminate lyase